MTDAADDPVLPAARIPPRLVRANAWSAWGGAAVCGFGGLMLWLAVGPLLEPTFRIALLAIPVVGAALCASAARSTLVLDDEGVALRGLGERRYAWDEFLAWEATELGGARAAELVARDGSRVGLPARFFAGDQAAHVRFALVRRLGPPVRDGWLKTSQKTGEESADAPDEG